MKQLLVRDYLVTVCCGKMEGLLATCQGISVPDSIEIAMVGTSGTLYTPIFYCPYCGEKIVVGRNDKMVSLFDNWAELPYHNEDHPQAKFKIGQRVKYHGKFEDLHGTWEVIGLNWMEGTTFEYALRGFPYLVWEDEIEERHKPPTQWGD